jgi:Thermolysin metallopeptidase, alpha-helical domain/FlgD Ig-like domain
VASTPAASTTLISGFDWSARSGSSLCNLANPAAMNYATNSSYPTSTYSPTRYCTQLGDEGGVHINSTIISHAVCRMAIGGDVNGCDIPPVGLETAEQVFYRSWHYYCSRTETFAQAYYDIQQACADLYSPDTCTAVRLALEAAEINLPGLCGGQPEPSLTCGVRHVTNALSAKVKNAVMVDDTLFAPGEYLTVHGAGNMPNRSLSAMLRVRPTLSLPNYWDMRRGSFTPDFVELTSTDANGNLTVTFHNALHQASTLTNYDLYIDGNNDGLWEPWADFNVPFQIRVPVDGDGACYSGETYATSENCHGSPLDCGCTTGSTCQQNASGEWGCVSTTAVDGPLLPTRFALAIAGSNPGRGVVRLEAALPKTATLDLAVYSVQGGTVRRLLNQAQLSAGTHSLAWDGRDDRGAAMPGGVYFVRMRLGGEVHTRTVVLLR